MSRFKREPNIDTANKTQKWKRSIIIYMAVWVACVLWFWLGLSGGGWIMAYTILSFFVILPVMTLVTAFQLERKQNLDFWRWIAMVFFGIMYAAAMWVTFVLSTFIGVANIATPPLYTLLVGLCTSAIGITLGWLVRTRKISLKIPAIGLFLLLVVVCVRLKTLNGAFFRPVLILDIPVAVLFLVLGLWFFLQRKKANIHIGLTQQDTRCSDSANKARKNLMGMAPAVETETKFVEISLQLGAAAMIST